MEMPGGLSGGRSKGGGEGVMCTIGNRYLYMGTLRL